MSKGAVVYDFTAGRLEGQHGGESIALTKAPVYSYGFYLTEQDTLDFFKVNAQYIPGRDYAICVTDAIRDEVEKLFSALK